MKMFVQALNAVMALTVARVLACPVQAANADLRHADLKQPVVGARSKTVLKIDRLELRDLNGNGQLDADVRRAIRPKTAFTLMDSVCVTVTESLSR